MRTSDLAQASEFHGGTSGNSGLAALARGSKTIHRSYMLAVRCFPSKGKHAAPNV